MVPARSQDPATAATTEAATWIVFLAASGVADSWNVTGDVARGANRRKGKSGGKGRRPSCYGPRDVDWDGFTSLCVYVCMYARARARVVCVCVWVARARARACVYEQCSKCNNPIGRTLHDVP